MRNDDNQDEWDIKAMLGYYEPKDGQVVMCACGWEGVIEDCHKGNFSNGEFSRLSGREGYHWHCPKCSDVVWRYYYRVS